MTTGFRPYNASSYLGLGFPICAGIGDTVKFMSALRDTTNGNGNDWIGKTIC